MILCEYGCGMEGRYQFKNGKWCCSKKFNTCLNFRKINSGILKGKIVSEETRKKMSEFQKGKIVSEETRRKMSEWQIGKRHSEETRKKISESNKGKRYSEETKIKMRESKEGEKNHFYGKSHSIESKNKMSEYHKGRIPSIETREKMRNAHLEEKNYMYGKTHSDNVKQSISKLNKGRLCGNKNPNWKGGIAAEPYCDVWLDNEYKKFIKGRDGNKCLNPYCCDGKYIHIHHIDYNKKNCGPKNLITLCKSCNAKANFDRDWHKSWYSAIIYRRYYAH